jgi:hypothetical protein
LFCEDVASSGEEKSDYVDSGEVSSDDSGGKLEELKSRLLYDFFGCRISLAMYDKLLVTAYL